MPRFGGVFFCWLTYCTLWDINRLIVRCVLTLFLVSYELTFDDYAEHDRNLCLNPPLTSYLACSHWSTFRCAALHLLVQEKYVHKFVQERRILHDTVTVWCYYLQRGLSESETMTMARVCAAHALVIITRQRPIRSSCSRWPIKTVLPKPVICWKVRKMLSVSVPRLMPWQRETLALVLCLLSACFSMAISP